MKNRIILVALLLVGFIAANAQGPQRRTIEERVKTIHEKMDSAFKPAAEKLTEIDAIFTDYYKASDKAREELMAGGARPDRDAMMAKMEPITTERDTKLKKVLGEDQFKKWKDEIEPSMRPQRRQQ
ncbi:MAG: hypothetical protein H7Y31_00495 [Chitinophagaceae bacterium]|nr:hypothetical protein [Chitinophagaceae bacterium]